MSFLVNMHGVIINSYDEQCKPGMLQCPVLHFLHFKLVLPEDFSKDESNKWSGNKELPEEGHWKVSYDELTECRKYL